MARRNGDNVLDEAVGIAAGVAVLVVTCGCMLRWSWIMPADEGPGPYRTHERVHDFVVLAVALGIAALLCVARAYYAEAGWPMFSAAALALLTGLFALGLYAPHDEAQIVGDGFGDDWYSTSTEGRFSFYNTTAAPITICLGISGDCDSSAKGPDRLHTPGLTVQPDHRLTVDTPKKAGDFKLTLVGPGFTHRDAILHVYVPDNSGP